MNKYLVSIIIPCFGNDSRLENALESLRKQIDSQFAVVLVIDQVDDGYYAQIHDKFKSLLDVSIVYLDSNTGITNATLEGIKVAESDWVALLDQDDWLDPLCVLKVRQGIEHAGPKVISLFTKREDQPQTKKESNFNSVDFNGWDLNKYFKDPLLTSLTHTWLSHLKVYKKTDFVFETDTRLDGIQDWYWNLENSGRGESIFIDIPLYKHRLHQNQNTHVDKFLKSISKVQLQRKFVSKDSDNAYKMPTQLSYLNSTSLLEKIRNSATSFICLIKGSHIEFHIYAPALLLYFSKNENLDIDMIILSPVSSLEFSEIYFQIREPNRPSIGLILSSEIPGSLQTAKNLGGLLDFSIVLNLEAEIFSSMSGIPTYHVRIDSVNFHRISEKRILKRSVKIIILHFAQANIMRLNRHLPIGTKRRALASRVARKYLI